MLGAFVRSQLGNPHALMPLRLLSESRRVAAFGGMLFVPAVMFGMFFFLTQFLQEVLHLSAVTTGVAFLPLTGTIFLWSRITPRLLPRVGVARLLMIGSLLITGGMVWLSQITATSSYLGAVLGPIVLLGSGVGMCFMPLTATILGGIEGRDVGAASGMLQVMQQLGGTLGLAVLVSIYGSDRKSHSLAQAVATSFRASIIFALIVVAIAAYVLIAELRARRRGALS